MEEKAIKKERKEQRTEKSNVKPKTRQKRNTKMVKNNWWKDKCLLMSSILQITDYGLYVDKKCAEIILMW